MAQVVATARKLQVAAVVRTRQLNDAPFDAKKQVFDARLVGVGCHAVCANGGHGAHDGRRIGGRDNAALRQHGGVGLMRLQHRLEEQRLGIGIGRLQHMAAVRGVGKGE